MSTKITPPKILVIVGPTASGKSDLAIQIAKKHNGEIISADSRQVYRGMDLGTGKITKKEQKIVKHWLLDVVSPKRNYNVTHFVRDAKRALEDIQKHGKVAIVCGGTGFWIQALLEGQIFPEVKPNRELRKRLEEKSALELFCMLEKKDLERAKTIDSKNKIRLIRALEIIASLGKVPLSSTTYHLPPTTYSVIALHPDKEVLQENIKKRLKKRLKQGMVAEVQKLRTSGISWKRLESFGLEYKNIALFLQEKISEKTMKDKILGDSWHYAKRQITWLKRWERSTASFFWVKNSQTALKKVHELFKP